MHGQVCMSVFVRQPIRLPAPSSHQLFAPHWLTHLGSLGLFSVAVVDSSVIPLPLPGSTDLLLLWLVAHSGNPWLLIPCAVAGSILGGYTTWHIGRSGGEEELRHYVPASLLVRIVGWIERERPPAVFLAACASPSLSPLPPCVPPSSHVSACPMDAGASVYDLERSRRGRLRCFAS